MALGNDRHIARSEILLASCFLWISGIIAESISRVTVYISDSSRKNGGIAKSIIHATPFTRSQ